MATAIVPSTTGGPACLAVSLSGSNQVFLIPSVGGGFFNDKNPRIFNVGTNPGPIFVGTFDGLPDLVTVNAGSNNLTLVSDFLSPEFTTRTIGSGGVDPVSAKGNSRRGTGGVRGFGMSGDGFTACAVLNRLVYGRCPGRNSLERRHRVDSNASRARPDDTVLRVAGPHPRNHGEGNPLVRPCRRLTITARAVSRGASPVPWEEGRSENVEGLL